MNRIPKTKWNDMPWSDETKVEIFQPQTPEVCLTVQASARELKTKSNFTFQQRQ